MASRGRGRGRGTSLPLESLGFGRGESLPTTILQPPPSFPVKNSLPDQIFIIIDMMSVVYSIDVYINLSRERRGGGGDAGT
jgi:hypothetical protein